MEQHLQALVHNLRIALALAALTGIVLLIAILMH
jgi:hypothetical protein